MGSFLTYVLPFVLHTAACHGFRRYRYPKGVISSAHEEIMADPNWASCSYGPPPWSCGVAEVCIHGDAPLGQEPFWDIAAIPVLLAPGMQLG